MSHMMLTNHLALDQIFTPHQMKKPSIQSYFAWIDAMASCITDSSSKSNNEPFLLAASQCILKLCINPFRPSCSGKQYYPAPSIFVITVRLKLLKSTPNFLKHTHTQNLKMVPIHCRSMPCHVTKDLVGSCALSRDQTPCLLLCLVTWPDTMFALVPCHMTRPLVCSCALSRDQDPVLWTAHIMHLTIFWEMHSMATERAAIPVLYTFLRTHSTRIADATYPPPPPPPRWGTALLPCAKPCLYKAARNWLVGLNFHTTMTWQHGASDPTDWPWYIAACHFYLALALPLRSFDVGHECKINVPVCERYIINCGTPSIQNA